MFSRLPAQLRNHKRLRYYIRYTALRPSLGCDGLFKQQADQWNILIKFLLLMGLRHVELTWMLSFLCVAQFVLIRVWSMKYEDASQWTISSVISTPQKHAQSLGTLNPSFSFRILLIVSMGLLVPACICTDFSLDWKTYNKQFAEVPWKHYVRWPWSAKFNSILFV